MLLLFIFIKYIFLLFNSIYFHLLLIEILNKSYPKSHNLFYAASRTEKHENTKTNKTLLPI